jgi:hypothetical protein
VPRQALAVYPGVQSIDPTFQNDEVCCAHSVGEYW